MAARIDSVAKYICEKSGWKLSNLQLQKILYLSQMMHIGRFGTRLVEADFEAWDYGPVEPRLYRKVREFGAQPIQDVFSEALSFKDEDPRVKFMDEVCAALLKKSPGQLVNITHWPEGAWAKNYVAGVRCIAISDDDIADEFRARLRKSSGGPGAAAPEPIRQS